MFFELIKTFGYLGIFLVSLISTSTIFLPFPLYSIITIASALGFNPFLVSILSALGMTIGEYTGYFIGRGGGKLLYKRYKKTIKKFEKFFKKFGVLTITIFAFLPFPFDIIGIVAGIGGFDMKKFFVATFVGKFFKAALLSYLGFGLHEILILYFA